MDEKMLLTQIDRFIADNREAMIDDMARLVAIRSVEEKPAGPTAPFGAGPRAALDAALKIAEGFGLSVNDGEGYVGWANLPGERDGQIATITHLDIVPEGDGWDADPLVLRRQDGWLLGRGVSDDKGPTVLCLYLAKFFKEQGLPLRYGLRVLLGSNEETGMEDVEYYLANHEQPLFAFSPDTDFPVCNGEKGVYGGQFISPVLNGKLVAFNAGIASNVVPEKASCTLHADAEALAGTDRVTVRAAGDGLVELSAHGIGGHAAHPERTINAIGLLVNYLLDNQLVAGAEAEFMQLLRRLHSNTGGSGLGIACANEVFTPLTCIGGVISLEGGVLRQDINIRYPTATTGEELTEKLQAAAAAAGGSFAPGRDAKPFYIPADSAPIQTLLNCWNEVSGRSDAPYTMGGGTYARHFKNAVSFGPAIKGREYPAFAGPEHAANEGVCIDDFMMALKVYILSIWRLQALEL